MRESRMIRVVTAMAVATFVLGCGDATVAAPDPVGNSELQAALARALSNPEVRSGVRDAMRASRVTSHKLVLQQFVGTPAGDRMIREASRAIGVDAAHIRASIAALPPLQFYMPARAQRRLWDGHGRVALAVRIGNAKDRTVRALDPAGDEVVYGGHMSPETAPALFLIEPLERLARRVDPQPDMPGATIEDENDGRFSGEYAFYDKLGLLHTIDVADAIDRQRANRSKTRATMDCGPEAIYCDTPPDEGGGGVTATKLQYFQTVDVCDHDDCWITDNEFRLYTESVTAQNTVRSSWTLWVYGLGANDHIDPNDNLIVIWDSPRTSGEWLNVNIVEVDPWNPDDNFDPNPNVTPLQNMRYNWGNQLFESYTPGIAPGKVVSGYYW